MTWAAAKKSPRGKEEEKKEETVEQEPQEQKTGGEWKPTRGNDVWIEDVDEAFVKSLVYKVSEDQIETEAGVRLPHQCYPINPVTQDGVPDHTMMDFLHDPNLLHNIQHRYGKDDIYSYIAYILIAVNPYKNLSIYTEEEMWKYRKGSMGALPPHVFAIAERSYRHMIGGKASQSVICSGDSGAGKTETAKYLLRYLTTIAGGGSDSILEKRILEANPIIEAFGNAKTLRNNNSSRFGKFVRVFFDKKNIVTGAEITTYLLERSRLVLQPNKERNFHVFYQLLSGASPEQRKNWLLDDTQAGDHRYTNQSQCVQIDDVDDKADFAHVLDALSCAGVSSEQQDQIMSMVAALLHLGNITFEAVEKDNADASAIEESALPSLNAFCKLVGIAPEAFTNAMLLRKMVVGDQTFEIPLKKDDAEFARDTLAKALYQKLFDYVVMLINKGMPINQKMSNVDEDEKPLFIGILDISGFEYFENNGFEQFLINFCNEKIQQYFVHQILNSEQQIYLQEGLRWKTVHFSDNFKCLELIELKTHGLLSLLQEQCMLPKGSDTRFTSNLTKIMVTNEKLILCNKVGKKENIPGLGARRFKNDEAFIIRHFAADVCYQTRGWLGKNNDGIHNDLVVVLQSVDEGSGSILSKLYPKKGAADEWEVTPQGKGENKSTRFSTISSTFQSHLNGLMDTLDGTESSFIRCINPNLNRKPGVINRQGVLTQLRCSGMLEALRIMQAGFPTRCLFTDLYARYKDMCPPEIASLNPKLFSEALLVALDLEGGSDFQMGLSRVFFRAGKAAMMDDIINGDPAVMAKVAEKIRKWLAKKRWRQFIWGVISMNRLGSILEDMREEKRRQEEARRLASEEYQMELRRKREEEERLLQEELRRKEEEERKRQEEEERKRKEKMERKLAKERELERLKKNAEEEAAKGKDLQQQLHQQQEMYEEVKMELLDEISALEFELQEEREARLAVEKELTETRSRERALLEMKAIADGEVERLRGEVSGLEDHLRVTQRQLHAAEEQLVLERENHKNTAINWERKYEEMLSFKDEEIERLKNEHAKQVLEMKAEMERMMNEMKTQADEAVAKLREEKEDQITRVEVMAEEKMTVLERTTAKVSKSGYLWIYEEGFLKNHWKKYYFVLKGNFLIWFHDQAMNKEAIGTFDLENARAYKGNTKTKEKKKYEGCEYEIRSPTRVINLRTDYARDVDPWMQAISMAKARFMASGTVNLDKVSVAAVKQGLVGATINPHSPR